MKGNDRVYLHLGSEVSVYSGDIVGIFDYKLADSAGFREFLNFAQWNKSIHRVEGNPKSIVLTDKNIYFVPVSRATLARRWERHNLSIKYWQL